MIRVSLADGKLIDEVRLEGGQFRFLTGAARDLFRIVKPHQNAEYVYRLRSDWSNGYIVCKEA